MKKLFSYLTEEEDIVYQWQFGYTGDFGQNLMRLIGMADEENQEKLEEGFPVEVRAWRRFARETGWWLDVQRKVKESENAK